VMVLKSHKEYYLWISANSNMGPCSGILYLLCTKTFAWHNWAPYKSTNMIVSHIKEICYHESFYNEEGNTKQNIRKHSIDYLIRTCASTLAGGCILDQDCIN